jgi:protein arginine N-methyltransferase 1
MDESWILEHLVYLGDERRNAVLERAIQLAVRPGDQVLDLGSGTGVLGVLACRAGAAHVFAVEVRREIAVAREVYRQNGFGDRVTFIRGWSHDITLPERVDAVVCDQIGFFGYQAGLIRACNDARLRHLTAGGRMLPEQVELSLVPVQNDTAHARLTRLQTKVAGVDLSPAAVCFTNTPQTTKLEPASLLSASQQVAVLDFRREVSQRIEGELELTITGEGRLDGLGGFFGATLCGDARMTTNPCDPLRIDRPNSFFPLDQPVDVLRGDSLRAKIQIDGETGLAHWWVRVLRQGRLLARFAQSTLRAMPLERSDVFHNARQTPC